MVCSSHPNVEVLTTRHIIGMVAFVGVDVLAGVDWRVDCKKEFDNVVFTVIIVEAFL